MTLLFTAWMTPVLPVLGPSARRPAPTKLAAITGLSLPTAVNSHTIQLVNLDIASDQSRRCYLGSVWTKYLDNVQVQVSSTFEPYSKNNLIDNDNNTFWSSGISASPTALEFEPNLAEWFELHFSTLSDPTPSVNVIELFPVMHEGHAVCLPKSVRISYWPSDGSSEWRRIRVIDDLTEMEGEPQFRIMFDRTYRTAAIRVEAMIPNGIQAPDGSIQYFFRLAGIVDPENWTTS